MVPKEPFVISQALFAIFNVKLVSIHDYQVECQSRLPIKDIFYLYFIFVKVFIL